MARFVVRLILSSTQSSDNQNLPLVIQFALFALISLYRESILVERRDEKVCMNTLCVELQTDSFVGRVGHRSHSNLLNRAVFYTTYFIERSIGLLPYFRCHVVRD